MREDRARLPIVRDAFGRAATAVRSEAAAAALVDAAEELQLRLAGAPSSPPPREGWLRPREGDGVPIPWAAAGLSPRDLARRRAAWVDARLPKGSRTAYVTAAFEAFLATSCGTFLGGGDVETCLGVGLLPLRRAALEAALAGLSGDGTEPGLAGTYLAVDPDLTTRALDEAAYRFGDVRRDDCSLLRAWLLKPPTRWQVRAALEPPLEP